MMTRYTKYFLRGEVVEPREMKEKMMKNDRCSSVSVWRSLPLLLKWQRTVGHLSQFWREVSTQLGCRY